MNSQDHNPVFLQWLAAYLDRLIQVKRGGQVGETIAPQPSGIPPRPSLGINQE
jgi:hypothetical protein